MNQPSSLPSRRRQRGALVIMLAASLVALFGFLALVIDLGRTYLVRTELQNAADAAALAGAKELDQTADGVGRARDAAMAIAAQHKFNFGTPVAITAANMWVGSCPDDGGCTMVALGSVTTDGQALDKTFLKVEIPSGNLASFVALAANLSEFTSTYGRAVAGWFSRDITAIGICALQDVNGISRPKGEVLSSRGNELAQFGFRRGVSYDIMELGKLAKGDPYLLNPVDIAPDNPSDPSTCDPDNGNVPNVAPFICTGTANMRARAQGSVYSNTGVSAALNKELNSRFDLYNDKYCTPVTGPQDSNITPYDPAAAGAWMIPGPTLQSIDSLNAGTPFAEPKTKGNTPSTGTISTAGDYGVLWSYSRAVRADTSVTPPGPGTPFAATPTDWATLYPVNSASAPRPSNYPEPSPYATGPHTTPGGVRDRRVLNLVIIDCPNAPVPGGGNCQRLPVLGIGRFFMQVRAQIPQSLNVEFAGLIEPGPIEIKLYK